MPNKDIWVLIRYRSDTNRTLSTNPFIEPFSAGFRDASDCHLQSFFESSSSRICETMEPREVSDMFSYDIFVVLDTHSLDARVATIYNRQPIYDNTDNEVGTEWRQTKVKFEGAWYLVAAIEEKPHAVYDKDELAVGWGKGELFDENGLYKIDDIELDD